jgi:hypothetical protein
MPGAGAAMLFALMAYAKDNLNYLIFAVLVVAFLTCTALALFLDVQERLAGRS